MLRRNAVAGGHDVVGRIAPHCAEMEFPPSAVGLERAVDHLDHAQPVAANVDLEQASREAVQDVLGDDLGLTLLGIELEAGSAGIFAL
jgi:hypothetical protein